MQVIRGVARYDALNSFAEPTHDGAADNLPAVDWLQGQLADQWEAATRSSMTRHEIERQLLLFMLTDYYLGVLERAVLRSCIYIIIN